MNSEVVQLSNIYFVISTCGVNISHFALVGGITFSYHHILVPTVVFYQGLLTMVIII